jgi:glycosyltransferase involved in cell wall biosynthesis
MNLSSDQVEARTPISSRKLVSVVTPVYNEQENLPELAQRVFAVADQLAEQGLEVELVLVDDCSHDRTPEIAQSLVAANYRVQYLRFARNCGSHAALSAGLAACHGDCAMLMAADLQDPPELLPKFIEHWKEGHDVVWAVRAGRDGETLRTRAFARIYYWVMRKAALPNMPATGADFCLVDRKVIDAYCSIGEKNTSIMAMLLWLGFKQTSFDYVKQARQGGRSGWTLAKKIKLFVDSLVSFSYLPIRLMSTLGILMAFSGFCYATLVVLGRLAGWEHLKTGTGFAALMTVLLVGQGTILLTLGVLGEYVWRSYDESRGRPRYVLERHLQSTAAKEALGSSPCKASAIYQAHTLSAPKAPDTETTGVSS